MKKLILLLFISYLGNNLFAHEQQLQSSRARGGIVWVSPSSNPYEHPVGSPPDPRGESPIFSSLRGQSADFESGMVSKSQNTYRRPVTPVAFEE